jgi:hypothetical protein
MSKTKAATATKKVLTESDAQLILMQRQRVEDLKQELKREQAALLAVEAETMAAVKAGARITGLANFAVVEETGDCRPKWKEEYVSHMVSEHAADPKVIESEMKLKYPGKDKEVLAVFISSKPVKAV